MNEQKNTYEYQVMRALKRKYFLISLRGGKCSKCGYNKNLSAFDFHHIDPNTKKMKLDQRSLSNSSMKLIMEEFEKCEVLCANCHREHHSPELEIEIVKDKISKFDENTWEEVKKEKKHYCEDCGCEKSKWGKKCKNCNYKSQRVIDRPDLEILIKIINERGYESAGREFNVTGKTIKKWVKSGPISPRTHNA
jgi:hypothetical protein